MHQERKKRVNRRTLSALAKPNIIQVTHLLALFNQHAIFKVFLMTVYNPRGAFFGWL